jgi:hypothetical protein
MEQFHSKQLKVLDSPIANNFRNSRVITQKAKDCGFVLYEGSLDKQGDAGFFQRNDPILISFCSAVNNALRERTGMSQCGRAKTWDPTKPPIPSLSPMCKIIGGAPLKPMTQLAGLIDG